MNTTRSRKKKLVNGRRGERRMSINEGLNAFGQILIFLFVCVVTAIFGTIAYHYIKER